MKTMKRLIMVFLLLALLSVGMTVALADTKMSETNVGTGDYSASVMRIGFTTTAYLRKPSTERWLRIVEANEYVTCEGISSTAFQISYPRSEDGRKMADRRQIDSHETDTHTIYAGIGANPDFRYYNGEVHLRIDKPEGYAASANMTTAGSFTGYSMLDF